MNKQLFEKGDIVKHCHFNSVELYITDIQGSNVKVLYLVGGVFKEHTFKIEELVPANTENRMGGNLSSAMRGA